MSPTVRPETLRMDPEVEPNGRRAALQLLQDGVCRSVDYCRSTPSTNSKALAELSHCDDLSVRCPKLFLTDQQTAGRGRHGRRWLSNDAVLTFSLIVSRSDGQGRVSQIAPLAVGVGIAEYLEFEFAPLQVKLKWPNDVHVDGGKVAGILIETSSACPDRMVIGVGINVGDAPELDSKPETDSARGLARVLGRSVDRYDLLAGLVTHILHSIDSSRAGGERVLDSFRQRCLLSGQSISFQDAGQTRQGRCQGVSAQGAFSWWKR